MVERLCISTGLGVAILENLFQCRRSNDSQCELGDASTHTVLAGTLPLLEVTGTVLEWCRYSERRIDGCDHSQWRYHGGWYADGVR